MSAPYYTPITSEMGIIVLNPEVIELLLIMGWNGINPPSHKHLEIRYPSAINPSCNHRFATFHKVLWDDVDESKTSPFRKARLRMEGSADGTPKVFGLLENINIDDPKKSRPQLTFSPVPFGPDGKPILPYKGQEREDFLRLAGDLLLGSLQGWSSMRIEAEINHRCSSNPIKAVMLENLRKLAVIVVRGGIFKVTMLSEEFEEIFGVKLPSIG